MTLVDRAIRLGIRRGWDRGVGEGSRVWVVIGGAALVARLARRALRREPEVVFSEEIKPGESFRVTHEAHD
ncbi:MAG TPA: hypothetical protein VFZ97_00420 [Acidimicrobiales bacterium]